MHTHVPVGMLVSSLGGSAIESWISQEHLKEFPQLLVDQAAFDSLKLARQDRGAGRWQLPECDDSDWATMTVPGYWRENGADICGTVWCRKTFDVPASMAGRHARLYMGTMVDSDSVFVNGTFVGYSEVPHSPSEFDVTDKLEAEYIYVNDLSGAGYSSAPSGTGLIQQAPAASNGFFLGYLNKAMELSGGKDAAITDSLGWLRYRQGRLEEAESLVRKAQSAMPADTEIALHLAEILYVVGKTAEADSYIASVLEGEPNNTKAKELRHHRGPAK